VIAVIGDRVIGKAKGIAVITRDRRNRAESP
jgi:hypothetical protein